MSVDVIAMFATTYGYKNASFVWRRPKSRDDKKRMEN